MKTTYEFTSEILDDYKGQAEITSHNIGLCVNVFDELKACCYPKLKRKRWDKALRTCFRMIDMISDSEIKEEVTEKVFEANDVAVEEFRTKK